MAFIDKSHAAKKPFFLWHNSTRNYVWIRQGDKWNALRYKDWKLHFAIQEGDITTAYRKQPSWPKTVNLRQDPYERFIGESQMYLRWMADKMWTMVPAQTIVRNHLESLQEFPPTKGSSLSVDKVL